MKVFKTLINELFGTKREYKVEGLGIFTCKVCDWWRDKCCLWSGAVQLPFYSVETLVLIEGDASAPFSRQLLELQVLLQNWVPMAEQLDSMLSSKSQQKHKEKIYGSWQDDFYPYTIGNHTIFRHANFIGCLSADKIKMPVRKYFCFNIPVYRNMAEEPSCRSPYHEEYIQTSVSGNSEGLCRSTYSFLSERR